MPRAEGFAPAVDFGRGKGRKGWRDAEGERREEGKGLINFLWRERVLRRDVTRSWSEGEHEGREDFVT